MNSFKIDTNDFVVVELIMFCLVYGNTKLIAVYIKDWCTQATHHKRSPTD